MANRDKANALFRAKLTKREHQKRIDDPLVRYNEQDKPFCRVCKFVLKSESDWLPHKASRRHLEALDNLKANAARKNAVNSTTSEFPKHRGDDFQKFNGDQTSMSSDVKKSRPSSALPNNFFDNVDAKRQKLGSAQVKHVASIGAGSSKLPIASSTQSTRITENVSSGSVNKQTKGVLPEGFFETKNVESNDHISESQPSRIAEDVNNGSGTKQAKGALPEGFFDNKEADLRARGIEPVKPDVKDEYKEFEKLIQVDLVEVDNRLEEEEIDAAEQIEEEESREQSTYRSKVEEIKRKKLELRAARSTRAGKTSEVSDTKSDKQDDSSSEDDEDDKKFAVDWRAQHL